MTPKKTYIIYFLLLGLLMAGCKGMKDTRIGKLYHNTTARFNGYFNAKERMKEAENKLFDTKQDNFSEVIDVYAVTEEDNVKTYLADMDVIIKKCTRVINKHDISKWVDDCYFLIGKAHFYKRDYFTAIETFEYVAQKYENTLPGVRSHIWIARAYMDMDKLDEAQAKLTVINGMKKFPEELRTELNLAEADYYIRTRQYDRAITSMEKVLPEVKKKKYKTRYLFILAQLYERQGKNDKATAYYKEVIKKNPVYELSFQSKIGLANVSPDKEEVKKYLEKLIKDDKNISYFDQIYYVLGKIALKEGNEQQALEYLERSVRSSKENQDQKAASYLQMADIYFARPDYLPAKAYYDSAANSMSKNFPQAEEFKRRQKVLGQLIDNLLTVEREDSLLRLGGMSGPELRRYLEEVDEQAKIRATQAQEEQERQRQMQNQQPVNQYNMTGANAFGAQQGQGSCIWGNPGALQIGAIEFASVWGNRPLQDNWRRLTTATVRNNPNDGEGQPGDGINDVGDGVSDSALQAIENTGGPDLSNIPPSLKKYYIQIPFTTTQKNLSRKKIDDALFQMGNIYYQDLREYDPAIGAYNELLKRYPKSPNRLPVMYNLYRLYTDMGNEEMAAAYKDSILTKFPGSTYDQLIQNPAKARRLFENRSKNQALEDLYAETFDAFQRKDCKTVEKNLRESNRRFSNNYLKSKFDYLKVLCYGLSDSGSSFVDSLKVFTLRYPADEVTAQASMLVKYLESKRKPAAPGADSTMRKDSATATTLQTPQKPAIPYKINPDAPHNLVFLIPRKANSQILKTSLSNKTSNFANLPLKVDGWIFDKDRQLVIVQNFPDQNQAMRFMNEINLNPTFFKDNAINGDHTEFAISADNLRLFLDSKDVDEYLKFYNAHYSLKK